MATHSGTDRRRVRVYRPQLEWMEDRQLLAALPLLPALAVADSFALPSLTSSAAIHAFLASGLHPDMEHHAEIANGNGPDNRADVSPRDARLAAHLGAEVEMLLREGDPQALAVVEAVRHELQAARVERYLSASVVDEYSGQHEQNERPKPAVLHGHSDRPDGLASSETNAADLGTAPASPAEAHSRPPSLAHGQAADDLAAALWARGMDSEAAAVQPDLLVAADGDPPVETAFRSTPPPGELLASFLPLDPAVLDQAVQHFLDEVHQIGDDVGTWLTAHHDVSALMVLAGMAVAACELRRRRLPDRPTMQAAARDAVTGAMPTILRMAAP